jgi:hypothetical protein
MYSSELVGKPFLTATVIWILAHPVGASRGYSCNSGDTDLGAGVCVSYRASKISESNALECALGGDLRNSETCTIDVERIPSLNGGVSFDCPDGYFAAKDKQRSVCRHNYRARCK